MPFVSKLAEADAAQFKLPNHGMRSAAAFTAGVLSDFELLFPFLLDNHWSLGHLFYLLLHLSIYINKNRFYFCKQFIITFKISFVNKLKRLAVRVFFADKKRRLYSRYANQRSRFTSGKRHFLSKKTQTYRLTDLPSLDQWVRFIRSDHLDWAENNRFASLRSGCKFVYWHQRKGGV